MKRSKVVVEEREWPQNEGRREKWCSTSESKTGKKHHEGRLEVRMQIKQGLCTGNSCCAGAAAQTPAMKMTTVPDC